jgi:hypothetical protein
MISGTREAKIVTAYKSKGIPCKTREIREDHNAGRKHDANIPVPPFPNESIGFFGMLVTQPFVHRIP